MIYTFFFAVLCIFNVLRCFGTDLNGNRVYAIIGGLLGALVSGILIFGAATRNKVAIIVWICINAVLEIIGVIFGIVILAGIGSIGHEVSTAAAIVGAVFLIAACLFSIWVIYVAKKAIDEITEGQ